MGSLDGKVALVTGAARGQGRSHAIGLAKEGASIIAVDVCKQIDSVTYPLATSEDLQETVAEIEKLDQRAVAREADVRDNDALVAAITEGVAELGGLDIVVANAGVWEVQLDEPTDYAERRKIWQDTLDINLTGVWNTVEAVTPILKDQGRGGAIVMTCSIQGLKGAGNNDISLTAYTASKHGLVGLMRTTAQDLAPHSIRVNTVHPTGVLTPMIANEIVPAYGEKHPQLGDLMGNALPVDVIEPQDVTNAVLFLVADTGKYITGVTLPVDAGAMVK
jgi:SDR family mycofactocin-dependent oxidoreductase